MSTLADLIISANSKLAPGIAEAAKAIAKAERFSVSDDVREACRNVIITRPTTLVAATAYARPPFDRCWFEWDAHPEERRPNNEAQITPLRIGAFITRIAPEAWTMWTAWSYSMREAVEHARQQFGDEVAMIVRDQDPGVGVSGMLLGVDLTQPIGAPSTMFGKDWIPLRGIEGLTDEQLAQHRDDEHNPVRYVINNPHERKALEALDKRMAWKIRDHDSTALSMLRGDAGKQAMIQDVQEEIAPMLATLILMNSKNCVETTKTEPPPKLNKARLKRGKAPLVSFSTVHINLSRTRQRAGGARGMSEAEMAKHKVRGHFKVRRTGVFWWNDYERGDLAHGRHRHDYKVET